MMVVLQHGLLLLATAGREFFYSVELGSVAVTTFFALSGFIVAEAFSAFYTGRPAAFLANRLLRIVPPYLAAWTITVLMDCWLYAVGRLVPLDAPLLGPPWQPRVLLAGVLEIVPGLTAARVSGQEFSFIPFAWTLRVECLFYLGFFGWGLLTAKCADPSRRRVAGAVILGAAYLAFAVFAWRHWGPVQESVARQVICVPFFGFGLGLYVLGTRPGRLAKLHLLLVSGGVLVAFTFWGQRGHPVLAYQLPLLAALYVTVAWLSRSAPMTDGIKRWDRRLGELSYPLYVSHGVILSLLAGLSPSRGLLPYTAAIFFSLALAEILRSTVERPLQGFRTRLRGMRV